MLLAVGRPQFLSVSCFSCLQSLRLARVAWEALQGLPKNTILRRSELVSEIVEPCEQRFQSASVRLGTSAYNAALASCHGDWTLLGNMQYLHSNM